MGRDSSADIATRYRLERPEIESRWGARFSASVQTGPGAHPSSYTMGNGSFPGVKRPGRGVDHPPRLSAEVKERVELYFYSPLGLGDLLLLTAVLTQCSRVLLVKLSISQLVKKFTAFYGTRRFITTFTSARHLSLSWARSIKSMPPHPTSWRSILILSSHLLLGFPSGVFPSGFLTKTAYTTLFSPICATYPANLILLDLIIRKVLGESIDH